MNVPSMDEMIKDCERKKSPDEVIAFTFGAGRIMPLPTDAKAMRKGMKEAAKFIQKQEGFLGFHPIDLWHTAIIYDTLNNTKRAYNELKAEGCPVGNIVPVLIPKEYAQRTQKG